jgi:beta-galactosidase
VTKPDVRVVPENESWHYKVLRGVKNPQLPEIQPGFDDSAWKEADPQANADSLSRPEQAVFRTELSVSADDLEAEGVQLKIGRIDDQGWVYVNGKLAGESHDWSASPSFDVKSFLHAGKNTVAIAVINDDGAGGVGNGVSLRLLEKAEAPKWQRRTFNGLAQIIVQSSNDSGKIKLTATANDLAPATVVIESKESM